MKNRFDLYVEDRPPFKDALFVALQHLLAIFESHHYTLLLSLRAH